MTTDPNRERFCQHEACRLLDEMRHRLAIELEERRQAAQPGDFASQIQITIHLDAQGYVEGIRYGGYTHSGRLIAAK